MAKLVLAYNFSEARLPALKLACMLVKVPLRVVPREQLLQPLGYLAGVPGVEPVEELYAGEEAREEMLILCGFNRPDLDRLLSAIRKGKLQSVALIARHLLRSSSTLISSPRAWRCSLAPAYSPTLS